MLPNAAFAGNWLPMKFFAPIATAAAILLVCGCETKDSEAFSRQIEIRSVPSGAPIVVDGLRMGKAPLSLGVETTEDGCFVRKTVVTAIPQDESLHTQVVTFPAFRISDPEKSRVPEKIIFDMTKSPAQGGGVSFGD